MRVAFIYYWIIQEDIMPRREKRRYTDEFKAQVVTLYNNGKPISEILREYDLT